VFRGHLSAFSVLALCLGFAAPAPALRADPLSKKTDVDFFRDVPSRNLKRLAARSDGRLVAGPILAELAVPAPADLLWCVESTADATKFLVGTGPEGRILEITYNAATATYGSRDVVKLDDPQIYALKPLADGSILVGTSPRARSTSSATVRPWPGSRCRSIPFSICSCSTPTPRSRPRAIPVASIASI
jgi:hypothetical protein